VEKSENGVRVAQICEAIRQFRGGRIHVGHLQFILQCESGKSSLGLIEELTAQCASGLIGRETLQRFLNNPQAIYDMFPSLVFATDLIPERNDGLGKKIKVRVLEDIAPSNFQVDDLELIGLGKDMPMNVSGEIMRQRAKELGANFGLVDAKRCLQNQEKIFSNKMYPHGIVFPGTVLENSNGYPTVPYLSLEADGWTLFFWELRLENFGTIRLVRPRPRTLAGK
jgi:hypothetical protein